MEKYTYEAHGTAAVGPPWRIAADVHTGHGIAEAMKDAMRDLYQRLTHGDARYGQPGEGGCQGPYKITRFCIWRDDA